MKNYSIAIDGPAGAGKSTIAKAVSQQLSFIYVDTGAMYRAMALFVLRNNIDPNDSSAISQIYDDVDIKIDYIDKVQQIYLNGENVTDIIRREEVGNAASIVSKHLIVREKLVQLQQKIASNTSVVMDGRDIGTVVLPNADLKIYLTASADERARRRYLDLRGKGIDEDIEQIKADIIARDEQDMNRKNSPLTKADDAVMLDSSNMSIEEVVSEILRLFNEGK
ncbi:MAG: (d)CMP kinase [Clostridiales bacterium]|nr:(d)CMP kinase [Clostridiales bacterium]